MKLQNEIDAAVELYRMWFHEVYPAFGAWWVVMVLGSASMIEHLTCRDEVLDQRLGHHAATSHQRNQLAI